MNERIKELAEQARKYVADAIELGFPQDQVDDIRDEKFAELIVRECAEVCMKEIDIGWAMAPKSPWMTKQILEHFGVEE